VEEALLEPTREEIEDEKRRARRVRTIVDLTCAMIAQGRPQRQDAERLVSAARNRILALFPGRDETYEIVYAPRFRRVMEEFARPEIGRIGTIVPFRARSSSH
jgi:hypothetical protein